MEFDQSLFGIAPEALHSIDIDLSGSKVFSMIDFDVTVSTEHQRVIASELIGVDNAPPTNGFHREVQQALSGDIPEDFHLDHSIALQNAENRDLVGRPSTSLAFTASPKVALVHLDLPAEQLLGIGGLGQDGGSDQVSGFEHRGITQAHLMGHLTCGEFQLKELEDPQPTLGGDPQGVDPTSTEVMEPVTTALAAKALTRDAIDFSVPTACAKTMAIFPTAPDQKASGCFLCLYQLFE